MYEFIKNNQLDIMLALSTACFVFGLMLFITKFLEKKRKTYLIFMEFVATFLLFFDRMAYIYAGDMSTRGYYMVRISNFMVFSLTAGIVLCFNWYLSYILIEDCKIERLPRRMSIVSIAAIAEMFMVVLSQFTGFYYYFDETNTYYRGPGFLLCYIVPIIGPLVQFSVILQYRKRINRLIYYSIVLYIFLPIIMGIVQIFYYGISIVNMAMVLVSISLYVFTYLDINQVAVEAYNHDMKILEEEKKSFKRLFDQSANAFMYAVEMRNEFTEGHSKRVANLSRRIAVKLGKSESECDEIYYAALLHNIGWVSIPDNILEKKDTLNDADRRVIEQVPALSGEILSIIKEYPYLKEAALYSHEQYDGNGYPLRMKGETIPEIARIIAVADAYDGMTSRRSYRGALPYPTVREELVKQAGVKFDPKIADIMVHLMDEEDLDDMAGQPLQVESEITCNKYRDEISVGIPVGQTVTNISFIHQPLSAKGKAFSEPGIVLFDAFDGQVHDTSKSVEAYHYMEYGEAWFDGHFVCTSARNMVSNFEQADGEVEGIQKYEITAAKYEDHVKLILKSTKGTNEVIVALPDSSKSVYIGLTGENSKLSEIQVTVTEQQIGQDDIPKIVEPTSYIDRFEADVKNVQIDRYRSGSTVGIPIKDKLRLDFHSMSLPESNLVWHCPYVVIYYSDTKLPEGDSYHEYALIKLNGEISGDDNYAENKFSMKKLPDFVGWDTWKERQKAGLEYTVSLMKKGNKIMLLTENLGLEIENTTIIQDNSKEVYVALTGDEVAITDIRIR